MSPKIPAIPPAPRITDPAVQKAAAEELARRRQGKGYQATILTQMMANAGLKNTLGG